MPAYNFQKRFAPAVARRIKRQTIRKCRKRPTVRGDELSLYYGQRTKQCQLLDMVICIEVRPVVIYSNHFMLDFSCHEDREMKDLFARADGFIDWMDMRLWFINTHGLPFRGELIQW